MTTFFRGNPLSIDVSLLILRVGSGAMMLTHGVPKLLGFSQRMHSFSDPFHIGSPAALTLAVFAEVICSLLLIAGYFTRFALIPLIILTATIVFMVSWGSPFAKQELAVFYLVSFLALFFSGPGKYSFDGK